jgi:hypothetical protein
LSFSWSASALLLALFTGAGCEESDNQGWLVDRTRVLGARVEAKSDPSRASIAPGESMRATWLVASPNGTGRLHWAYVVCAPVAGHFPEPHCESTPLAAGTGRSDGELVVMDLDAPAAQAVGDAQELQLLAAFCEDGDATLDAARFEATCADRGTPRLASATIRLTAGGANRNPEIVADAVLFDGSPMGEASRPSSSCAAEAKSPVVAAGTKHEVALRFRGDEREAIPDTREGAENVLASHVVTAGKLERQYSMLDPSDPVPKEVSVEWTAPARVEIADGGRLVELYVVLRDGRGGEAFARRTVCVRP